MRKLRLYILCALCLVSLWLQPLQARAVTPLEPERPCSLRLDYSLEGVAFEGLTIRIYRVAEAFPDGTFELLEPYAGYPVNIHGITSQTEWQQVAETLKAYIVADQVEPTYTAVTDAGGMAHFADLQTGLYLVLGVVAENDSGMYQFRDFMVYLPTPQPDENFLYDVEAKPKCSRFTPYTQYSVRKLWKDPGNEAQRPTEVLVDIFKDGIFVESVSLNAENDWCYSWRTEADGALWTVTEKSVPEEYLVVISQVDNAFVITNTDPGNLNPPDTGEIFPLSLLMIPLCLAGVCLMALGARRERKEA